jgi:hypothetical protein
MIDGASFFVEAGDGIGTSPKVAKLCAQRSELLHLCETLRLEKMPIATKRKVMGAFLECLAGGLRHFMALRNGGPPGPVLTNRGGRVIERSPLRPLLVPSS